MQLPIPVFSEEECKGERVEGIICPNCREKSGEMISAMGEMIHEGKNLKGVRFNIIVWERWQCTICRRVWVEKYGVARGQEASARGQEAKRASTTYPGSSLD